MQQQLEQMPLIKKLLELIGMEIKVPGAFWEGRMSAAEKQAQYVCVVRDFSALSTALHKFIDGTTSQAFELQEMGAAQAVRRGRARRALHRFDSFSAWPFNQRLRTRSLYYRLALVQRRPRG